MNTDCLRCRCEESVHRHYRAGTDCGRCGTPNNCELHRAGLPCDRQHCEAYVSPLARRNALVLALTLAMLLAVFVLIYSWLT